MTEPILEAVSDSLAAVAGLFRPCGASAEGAGSPCTEKALAVLEDFSDSLDYLVVQMFSSLFGAMYNPEADTSEPGEAASAGRFSSLKSVAVWAIAVLVRAVGCKQFHGRYLWEWANGDPFAIFVIAKGLLAGQPPPTAYLSASSAPEDSPAPWPGDWVELREAVWGALLELPAPDIVFQPNAQTQSLEDADIVERHEALWLHRSLLAVAAADCGLLDVLLPHMEHSLNMPAPINGHRPARPLAAASFLAALVQPPMESLPSGLHEFTAAFVRQLELHASRLWHLLGRALEVPLTVENRDKRLAHLRSLLRDCASLAFAAPPSAAAAHDFLHKALSEQSSDVSLEVRGELKALAALVVFAANAGLVPGEDHLTNALLGLSAPARAEVGGRASQWRGLVRVVEQSPWQDLLGSRDGLGIAAEDEEDDDFFTMMRREMRAAKSQAGAKPEATAAPAADGTISPVTATPVPVAAPPPLQHPAQDAGGVAGANGLRELLQSVPPELCCALDGKPLVDPVRSPYGHAFERSALQRALAASGGLCPITGQPLALAQCPREAGLRKQVLRWVRETRRPRGKR